MEFIKKYIMLLLLLLSLLSMSLCDMTEDEDDDLLFDLGKLYQETQYELDPNDMLTPRKRNKYLPTTDDDETLDLKQSNSHSDATKEELHKCQTKVTKLENKLKEENINYKSLLKKFKNEATIDFESYYLRMVNHLWSNLEVESITNKLQTENDLFTQYFTVSFTRSDVLNFKEHLKNKNKLHEIDGFLEGAFKVVEPPDKVGFWSSISMKFFNLSTNLKNIEIWLHIMCYAFVCLGLWAVYLFIQDIKRELRWQRVIIMMCVLVFIICCLWHWRHMHKVAESKKHAKIMKRGFADLPDECKPGHESVESWTSWIARNVGGGKDPCEEYYEDIMITTEEEISPGMVIAETITKFVLQPMQLLGIESAKFVSNFYGNIPLIYQLPATLLFIIVFILLLFVLFGYGIDFPFWLGGIRPMPVSNESSSSTVEESEILKKIMQEQQDFMKKSREVLSDIAQTCIQHNSNKVLTEPVMSTSVETICEKLSELVSLQLAPLSPQRKECNAKDNHIQDTVDSMSIDCSSQKYPMAIGDTPTKFKSKKLAEKIELSLNNHEADCDIDCNPNDFSYSDLGAFGKTNKYVHNEEFASQLKNVFNDSMNESLNLSCDSFSTSQLEESPRHLHRRAKNKSKCVECSPRGKVFLKEVEKSLQL